MSFEDKLNKAKGKKAKKPDNKIVQSGSVDKRALQKEIKEAVKIEMMQATSELTEGVSELHQRIARDLANGDTDAMVRGNYGLKREELASLYRNPKFMAKLNHLVYENTFADKNVRVRANNKLLDKLWTNLATKMENGELDEMPIDKQIKAYKELMDMNNKMLDDEKTKVKIDITQIINQEQRSSQRNIKKKADGSTQMISRFPVLDNDSGEIVGDWEGVDAGLSE